MKKNIINIVNFVRAEDYRNTQEELYDTFKQQVELCRQYPMPYTFLLQYDALIHPEYVALLLENPDSNCEVGVWFEMAQEQVEKCGIKWRGEPGTKWDWRVNPGLLMAYTLEERKSLIDELFGKFHEVFGHYPKSAGAWMLDTYSIQYMTEQYGVDAFCICKDQYGTDGYTLWGGYYNQAYYPSKRNMFMPAQTKEMQLNAPVFRMLGSDPIYQYTCSADEHFNPAPLQHVFSLEPVWKTGQSEKWVDWYLHNNFEEEGLAWAYTQAGQENSFCWRNFGQGLTMQMAKFYEGVQEGRWEVMTLGESGRWFKKTFPMTPVTAVTCMDDWQKQGRQTFWYDCKNYRVSFYTDRGHVCIRDMFLFDERHDERYWDTVATGNTGIYDAFPFVDGYRWSGHDTFCSIEWVDAKGQPLPGCIESVGQESETVLVATLSAGQKKVQVRCDEEGVSLSNLPDGASLRMAYDTTADTEITDVSSNRVDYRHDGCRYSLLVEGGTVLATENGYKIQINAPTVRLVPART